MATTVVFRCAAAFQLVMLAPSLFNPFELVVFFISLLSWTSCSRGGLVPRVYWSDALPMNPGPLTPADSSGEMRGGNASKKMRPRT